MYYYLYVLFLFRADADKWAHFEKIYEKTKEFYGEGFPDKEKFFVIFCRTWINSHTVHTSAGHEVGMAIDLGTLSNNTHMTKRHSTGVSRYDHSCRPTCSLIFDGFRATLRSLVPDINLDSTKEAFISYIDVGRSRYQRRRELKLKWCRIVVVEG